MRCGAASVCFIRETYPWPASSANLVASSMGSAMLLSLTICCKLPRENNSETMNKFPGWEQQPMQCTIFSHKPCASEPCDAWRRESKCLCRDQASGIGALLNATIGVPLSDIYMHASAGGKSEGTVRLQPCPHLVPSRNLNSESQILQCWHVALQLK